MNAKMLRLIALKIRNKYPESVVEQVNRIPTMLTTEEQNYLGRQLKTSAFYREKKLKQRAEREKQFFEQITIHNPFRSKNIRVANRKERELLRPGFYNHISKQRLTRLLSHFVLSCSSLSPQELMLLTDPLLISCIDSRLRRYVRIKATKLGSNQFAYYLIKENWKRESNNHLIWKFELKRMFGFKIEQKFGEFHRVDLLRVHSGKKVIGEIVCTRQSSSVCFQTKIKQLLREFKGGCVVFVLAPDRLHVNLRSMLPKEVILVNAKTVLPFLQNLFAQKFHADNDYIEI